jgi:Ca2+-binding RTX toxin-like protein
MGKTIDMGSGDDKVQIDGNFQGTTDTSMTGDNSTGHINLGSGDDLVQLQTGSNFDNAHVDGGSGTDTLYFTGSASDYAIVDASGESVNMTSFMNNNGTGNSDNSEVQIYRVDSNGTHIGSPLNVKNIEKIVFEADEQNVDAVAAVEAVDAVAAIYEYPITLEASGDGLGVVTLDNLPTGATLSGAGVTGNTVDLTILDDANPVLLTSNTEITPDALNSMSASITSTEANGGDTATTTTTAEIEVTGTDANDTLVGTDADEVIDGGAGADTIDAGAGDDTIIFDSNDTIDGGLGFDTLALDDISIDFTVVEDGSIKNIESIDLGDGQQSITLDISDVLSMTDADNILRIEGDENDTLNLNTEGTDAEWKLGDFKTDAETGATYQEVIGVEDDATVTLEISTNIEISES